MGIDVFPERLAIARVTAGISGAELCSRIGLRSRSVVTKWERGKGMPDTPTMPLLAVALGTTTDHLLGVDLLRDASPAVPIDLAATASGTAPLSWSGRPLTSVDRHRALTVLHGLLAPADQLSNIPPYLPSVHKEGDGTDANTNRHRAQVVANIPARRPRTKGRTRGEGGAGQQPADGSHQ